MGRLERRGGGRAVKDGHGAVAVVLEAPGRDDGAACRVRQHCVRALRAGCSPPACIRVQSLSGVPQRGIVLQSRAQLNVRVRRCRDSCGGALALHMHAAAAGRNSEVWPSKL